MGKIFEQELLEHIHMLRHAHGEGDNELETESVKAFAYMRRDTKEKELNALFSGDCDPSLALLSAAKHINPDYAYKGLARIGDAIKVLRGLEMQLAPHLPE